MYTVGYKSEILCKPELSNLQKRVMSRGLDEQALEFVMI